MNVPVLTTTRLILRPLELADADSIQKRFPPWEVVRFLVAEIPWPYPDDGAERFVRELALPAMRAGREWHWSIRLANSSDDLIGIVSLMDKPDNNRGFWIDPHWQGQGFASEASAAVTDFWFEKLGRSVLRVPKAATNTPSRRISERTGMRLVGTAEGHYVSGRHLTEIWEITRRMARPRFAARHEKQDELGICRRAAGIIAELAAGSSRPPLFALIDRCPTCSASRLSGVARTLSVPREATFHYSNDG